MLKKHKGFFITGTDTGVGKTFVSALLCEALKKHHQICYYKPVQTGCETDDDTRSVVQQAQLFDGEWIDPSYRLKAPLSPDRAAKLENVQISVEKIMSDFKSIQDRFLIVEGAGGLEVPITEQLRMSGLMQDLQLPVLIVASTRLGTINHTLLTVQRAKMLGLEVMGVVLNGPEDKGLLEVLEREGVPVLFSIPFCESDTLPALQIVNKVLSEKILSLSAPQKSTEIDKKYIWHPFTQYGFDRDFPQIISGKGSELTLASGETIIDAISSWWVNLHGHGESSIAAAISRQAHQLEHAIFSGYTHQPAMTLVQKLLPHLQKMNAQLTKVFFSDNGSTAVEVALKMAYQYQAQIGQGQKKKFLALRGSYHGDTLAAMSVSEREGFHQVFTPLMAPVDFLTPDDFDELEAKKSQLSQYAAIIFEPLIQGASGMRHYTPQYLQKLCSYAKEAGCLIVADEIFTGFFRTGSFFACEQAQVAPDLICLSKGLTGGFLPLSLTVATEKLFLAFEAQEMKQAFLHGHSYTANPIACAAAVASLELLETPACQQNIRQIQAWTANELTNLQNLPMVSNPRSLGTIGAFEAHSEKNYLALAPFSRHFAIACEKRGALVRPLGGTVYTVPPYCSTEKQIKTIYRAISETLFDIQRGTL